MVWHDDPCVQLILLSVVLEKLFLRQACDSWILEQALAVALVAILIN